MNINAGTATAGTDIEIKSIAIIIVRIVAINVIVKHLRALFFCPPKK
jgi:hypothetical protein